MHKALQQFLKSSGMSQYRLAKLLDVDRSEVTRWVQGKRKPARKHLKEFSQITGIKLEELL